MFVSHKDDACSKRSPPPGGAVDVATTSATTKVVVSSKDDQFKMTPANTKVAVSSKDYTCPPSKAAATTPVKKWAGHGGCRGLLPVDTILE